MHDEPDYLIQLRMSQDLGKPGESFEFGFEGFVSSVVFVVSVLKAVPEVCVYVVCSGCESKRVFRHN